MKSCTKFLSFLALGALFCGCSDEVGDFKGQLIDVPLSNEVSLTAADSEIVSAMNVKSFEFFNQLVADPDGCTNFSPLSLSLCAALYANALPESSVNQFLQWYDVADIATFNQCANRLIRNLYQANSDNDFALANSVWYRGLAHPTNEYRQVVNSLFYSEVNNYDNCDANIINQWINVKTSGLLQNFADKFDFSTNDFVMINCMYFNDGWKEEFKQDNTRKEDFHGVKATTTVDMMHGQGIEAQSYEHNGEVLIKLPFKHDAELLIYMPEKTADFATVCSNLKYDRIAEMEQSLTERMIDLKIPKFEARNRMDLTYVLEQNGLNLIIAMLPGLSLEKATSTAQQLSYFEIDEKGATAASATIISGWGANPTKSYEINRPFVYILKSGLTDAILMMGAITDL